VTYGDDGGDGDGLVDNNNALTIMASALKNTVLSLREKITQLSSQLSTFDKNMFTNAEKKTLFVPVMLLLLWHLFDVCSSAICEGSYTI
jgi:hypothetical protein